MPFLHTHPYPPFIPRDANRLILGTLPPPRFSAGELRPKDVNFCYGSCDNLLWPILERVYNIQFRYDNSRQAVSERKEFLYQNKIGICDIVESCLRQKKDASDIGMKNLILRDILGLLEKNPSISTLLFMGGNAKNSPENLFRSHLRVANLQLQFLEKKPCRKHSFIYKKREITTFSLISPSNAANRAIGMNPFYKMRKKENPQYTTLDFRVALYRTIFTTT